MGLYQSAIPLPEPFGVDYYNCMGVSTNGQLCYGVRFGEGYTFPWDAEEHEGDIDDWWRHIKGYRPPFELFGPDGNYLPTVELVPPVRRWDRPSPRPEVVEAYFAPGREWDAANPVPVALVNYCSGNYPMYIVAVPSSCEGARRGYPEIITPENLRVSPEEVESLLAFCREHGMEFDAGPAWWLSSYWG